MWRSSCELFIQTEWPANNTLDGEMIGRCRIMFERSLCLSKVCLDIGYPNVMVLTRHATGQLSSWVPVIIQFVSITLINYSAKRAKALEKIWPKHISYHVVGRRPNYVTSPHAYFHLIKQPIGPAYSLESQYWYRRCISSKLWNPHILRETHSITTALTQNKLQN